MINFLVGETTVILENVVVNSTRSSGDLFENRLSKYR